MWDDTPFFGKNVDFNIGERILKDEPLNKGAELRLTAFKTNSKSQHDISSVLALCFL